MTEREEMAMDFFSQGFNCAQGVLLTHAQSIGLDKETAALIGSNFGGGVSRKGNVCGAVTGALMALGMKFGNKAPGEKIERERAYEKADEFMDRFSQACGSIICRDLLGVDLSQPGVLEKAREDNLFEKNCPRYVGIASDIVEDMLKEGK